MSRGRPRHSDEQREHADRLKRQRLLSAGRQIFVENGYDGATADLIVSRCGLSKKTFYDFYPSKCELLLELAQEPDALILHRNFDFDPALPLVELLLTVFGLAGLDFDRHFFGLAAWEARKEAPSVADIFTRGEIVLTNYLMPYFVENYDTPVLSEIIFQIVYGRPVLNGLSSEGRIETVSSTRQRLMAFAKVFQPSQ